MQKHVILQCGNVYTCIRMGGYIDGAAAQKERVNAECTHWIARETRVNVLFEVFGRLLTKTAPFQLES